MNVFFGVPTRGMVDPDVVKCHQEIARELGTEVVHAVGHLSAAMTRNQLLAEFLKGKCDVLVMCDDDVVPGRKAATIVDGLECFDIVAGAVPIFSPNISPKVCFAAFQNGTPGGWRAVKPQLKLVECEAVGFGYVAMRRQAVEGQWFGEHSVSGRTKSDDIVYCDWARGQGFKIACDFRITCDHHARVSLGALVQAYGVN